MLVEVEKDYREEEHPRDEHGRWTSAGGAEGAAPEEKPAEPKAGEPARRPKVTQADIDDLRGYVEQLADKGEEDTEEGRAASIALAEAERSVERPPATPEQIGAAREWVDRAQARVDDIEKRDQAFKDAERQTLSATVAAQHELDAAQTDGDPERIASAQAVFDKAIEARDEAHDALTGFHNSGEYRGAFEDLAAAEERVKSLNVPPEQREPLPRAAEVTKAWEVLSGLREQVDPVAIKRASLEAKGAQDAYIAATKLRETLYTQAMDAGQAAADTAREAGKTPDEATAAFGEAKDAIINGEEYKRAEQVFATAETDYNKAQSALNDVMKPRLDLMSAIEREAGTFPKEMQPTVQAMLVYRESAEALAEANAARDAAAAESTKLMTEAVERVGNDPEVVRATERANEASRVFNELQNNYELPEDDPSRRVANKEFEQSLEALQTAKNEAMKRASDYLGLSEVNDRFDVAREVANDAAQARRDAADGLIDVNAEVATPYMNLVREQRELAEMPDGDPGIAAKVASVQSAEENVNEELDAKFSTPPARGTSEVEKALGIGATDWTPRPRLSETELDALITRSREAAANVTEAQARASAAAREYDALPRDAPIEQIQAASDKVAALEQEVKDAKAAAALANEAASNAPATISKETLDRLEEERSTTRNAMTDARDKQDETRAAVEAITKQLREKAEEDPAVQAALAKATESDRALRESPGRTDDLVNAMYTDRTALERARSEALLRLQAASPEFQAAQKVDDAAYAKWAEAKDAATQAMTRLDIYREADAASKNDAIPPMLTPDEFHAAQKSYDSKLADINGGMDRLAKEAEAARATIDSLEAERRASGNPTLWDADHPTAIQDAEDAFRAANSAVQNYSIESERQKLDASMGPSYWATYYDQPDKANELEQSADERRGSWIHIGGTDQASYRFAAQIAFGLDEGITWDKRKGGLRDASEQAFTDRAGTIARWAGQMRLEYRDSQAEINSEDGIERPGSGGEYDEDKAKDDFYQSNEYSDAESQWVSDYVDNMSASDKFDLLDKADQGDARAWMRDNLDEVEKRSDYSIPTLTDAWKGTDEARALAERLHGESEYARIAERYGETVADYSVLKEKPGEGDPGDRVDVQVAAVEDYLAKQYTGQGELPFDESGEPIRETPPALNGPALSEFRTAVAAEASARQRGRDALAAEEASKEKLFAQFPEFAKMAQDDPHGWSDVRQALNNPDVYSHIRAENLVRTALGLDSGSDIPEYVKSSVEVYRQAEKDSEAANKNAVALGVTRNETFETLMEPVFEERISKGEDQALQDAHDEKIDEFIEDDDAGKKAWLEENPDDWRDKAYEQASESFSNDWSAQNDIWENWWEQNKNDYRDESTGEQIKREDWPVELHRAVNASTSNYVSNFAESWSLSSSKASGFGRNRMTKDVDPKTVLTFQGGPHWRAKGFGLTEYEFILLSQYPKWQRQQIMRDILESRRRKGEARKGASRWEAGDDPRAADSRGEGAGRADDPGGRGRIARWAGAAEPRDGRAKGYDPDQPRDDHGRWSDSGDSAGPGLFGPTDNFDKLKARDPHGPGGPWEDAGRHHSRYGVVVMDGDKVLLREPSNHYEGFVWTFARGGRDHGEHPADTAVREGREELGHEIGLDREIPHVFRAMRDGKPGKWASLYYLAHSKRDTGKTDWETASTRWATYDEARKLIAQTTNVPGRERDLEVLDAAFGRGKYGKGATWWTKEWNEALHPRGEGGRFVEGEGQVSWEASPHPDTGILQGINTAPYAERQEYLRAVSGVIRPGGHDLIAEALGVKLAPFEAAGLYEGAFNPGEQATFPRDTSKADVETYCAAVGYVTSQKAVAYNLPKRDGDTTMGVLDLGGQITDAEMRRLYDAMGEKRDGAPLIPSREGVRVLNFTGLDDDAFHETIKRAAEALARPTNYYRGRCDAGLIENDWAKETHGEGYRRRLSAAGRSDLQGRLDDLAAAVERLNERFAREHGWGEAHRRKAARIEKARAWGKAEADRVDREVLAPWIPRFAAAYRGVVKGLRAEVRERRTFNRERAGEDIASALLPLYRKAMMAAARDCAQSLLRRRKAVSPGAIYKAETEVFPGKGEVQRITDPISLSDRVKSTAGTIYDAVERILQEAAQDDLDPSEVDDLIESEFEDILGDRAIMVGTTEAGAAVENARAAVLVNAIEQGEWSTVGDEKVRPTHVIFGEAGARPIGFNWAKLVGMGETLLRWPHDEECEEPSLTANCRCVLIPADDFEGTEEELNALLGDLGEAWGDTEEEPGTEPDDTLGLGADDYITKDYDPDQARDPLGRWTRTGLSAEEVRAEARTAPILRGLDSETSSDNRHALIEKWKAQALGREPDKYGRTTETPLTPEQWNESFQAQVEQLQGEPLTHCTQNADAVVEMFDGGIRGNWAVTEDTGRMLRTALREAADMPEGPEKQAIITKIDDMQNIKQGTTNRADKILGLDQFAFMTHGNQLGIYGPMAVLVDNSVLDERETWATPEDIFTMEAGSPPRTEDYPPELVQKYRDTMLKGTHTLASEAAWRANRIATGNRIDLALGGFEIKSPLVTPDKILGVVVPVGFHVDEGGRAYYGGGGTDLIAYLKANGVPEDKIIPFDTKALEARWGEKWEGSAEQERRWEERLRREVQRRARDRKAH